MYKAIKEHPECYIHKYMIRHRLKCPGGKVTCTGLSKFETNPASSSWWHGSNECQKETSPVWRSIHNWIKFRVHHDQKFLLFKLFHHIPKADFPPLPILSFSALRFSSRWFHQKFNHRTSSSFYCLTPSSLGYFQVLSRHVHLQNHKLCIEEERMSAHRCHYIHVWRLATAMNLFQWVQEQLLIAVECFG